MTDSSLRLSVVIPIFNERDNLHPLTAQTLKALKDRKSTRLNSSHSQISYAVFCLKKKNKSYAALTRKLNSFTEILTASVHQIISISTAGMCTRPFGSLPQSARLIRPISTSLLDHL